MKSKKGMIGIFTIFVLILIIIVLAMAQNGMDSKTINSTIDTLNWSRVGNQTITHFQNIIQETPNEYVKIILSVAEKAIDFFGYTIMEIGKLAMQLARDNPDIINYKVLLFLITASLIAPLIYPVFIVVVSLILIIKEAIQNRREKKLLGANNERQSRKQDNL